MSYRWDLLLQKYPKASPYLEKRLGANFPRWGAPWLQVFTASSFASSRGEGANKDYKSGVVLRSLSLCEAYDQVTSVQDRKSKNEKIREIRAGTSRVDSQKLCKQWFPDISKALDDRVSGYATQLCHEEMGSSGNYTLLGIYEPGRVPQDEDAEGHVTLNPVAEVPDVNAGALDISRFTTHLDNAELAEKDPFRRAGVASFLSSRPGILESCKVAHIQTTCTGSASTSCSTTPWTWREGRSTNRTGVPAGWRQQPACPAVTSSLPLDTAMGRLPSQPDQPKMAQEGATIRGVWTYGNASTMVKISLPDDSTSVRRTATVHCPGLDKELDLPVHEHRRAKQAYGKLWGKSWTVTSLICLDFGYLQQDDAEEYYAFLERMEERVRKRKAAEMAAPERRPLLEAKQAVSNVKDFNRPTRSRRVYASARYAGRQDTTGPLALRLRLQQTPRISLRPMAMVRHQETSRVSGLSRIFADA